MERSIPILSVATRRDWLFLALITVLALVLRLVRLDAALWYDEIETLVKFARLPFSEIATTFTSFNNHVLFSLQAHLSLSIFGESNAALRAPAVVFGVATVPVMWLLMRQIGTPMRWAHATAILLALNYHMIWFAQNARGYSGIVFWCLLATLFMARLWAKPRLFDWLGFVIAAACAGYTHLSAGFFIAALSLVFAARALASARGDRRHGIVTAIIATAVLVAILYLPVMGGILSMFSPATEGAPTQQASRISLQGIRYTLWAVTNAVPIGGGLLLLLAAVVAVVVAAGMVEIGRRAPWILMILLVQLVVTIAMLMTAKLLIYPRYFLFALPFLVAFVVAGTDWAAAVLARLPVPGLSQSRLFILGITIGVVISALWAVRNYAHPKQDFAGAVAAAEKLAQPGDVVASVGLAAFPISRHYAPDWPVIRQVSGLRRLMDDTKGDVWLIYGFERNLQRMEPSLMTMIRRDFQDVTRFPGTLGDGAVYLVRAAGAR